jgi:predicted enzyme related to lactoylglutathione lyase
MWRDLTVPDAEAIQRFYSQVVGWKAVPYQGDFNMTIPGDDTPVAGICHAKGANSKLPAQWLLYVIVPDLKKSVQAAKKGGGKVLDGPRGASGSKFCVIQDPAGAVIALYQSGRAP